MAFAHWVGLELAPILRERGLWTADRDPLARLRDMASLSHAAINALHSWQDCVASAIEARSDATPKSDAAEGESAIPEGETPR